MSTRKENQKLEIPVNIPNDVKFVEIDIDPTETTGQAMIFTFHKTDGTKVKYKSAVGELTTTGLNITLTTL